MLNLNKNLKPEITVTSFAFRIRDALEALNIDPKPFEGKIHKAATKLWNNCVGWTGEEKTAQLNGSFSDFASKAKENFDWLKFYGVTADKWVVALFRQPNLFPLKASSLRDNFNDNVTWLKKYSVTPEQWANACMRQPALLEMKAENLKATLKENLKWLAPHHISGMAWVEAALKQPSLFYQAPARLKKYYRNNRTWSKKYGVTAARWKEEALRRPSGFYQKPATLQLLFELSLAITESPYFKFHRKTKKQEDAKITFRSKRIDFIFNNGYLSLDNLLMRLAFAEIVDPAPSSALLRLTRDKIEDKIVTILGHNPNNKIIPVTVNGSKQSRKNEGSLLKKELKELAEALTVDMRTRPKPKEPRPIAQSIMKILLPEHDEPLSTTDKTRLLNRLVQGGLLKHYRFAA